MRFFVGITQIAHSFGGVDLGFTKGGVEVTVETETHEVTVDQMGETPINEYITSRTCTVSPKSKSMVTNGDRLTLR